MSGAAKSTENYKTILCLLENADRTVLGRSTPIDDETKGELRFTAMKPHILSWKRYLPDAAVESLQEKIKKICMNELLKVDSRAQEIEKAYNAAITSSSSNQQPVYSTAAAPQPVCPAMTAAALWACFVAGSSLPRLADPPVASSDMWG